MQYFGYLIEGIAAEYGAVERSRIFYTSSRSTRLEGRSVLNAHEDLKPDATTKLPKKTSLQQSQYLLADKGYDSDQTIDQAENQGMIAVIPPRKNRKVQEE